MKKILLGSVIIIFIITGIVSISIAIIDYAPVYQEFAKRAKVDPAVIKANNFRVARLPVPHLIIDNIKQEGKIALKDVKIEFFLSSLFRFSPEVKQITVAEVTVYLDNDDVNLLDHNEFISELIAKDIFSTKMHIGKLTFIESDKDVALSIDNFNLSGQGNEISNETIFDGTTGNGDPLKGSFEKSSDKTDDIIFKMSIEDKNYNFNLTETYTKGALKDGKAELKTKDISAKIVKLLSDFGNIQNYFQGDEEVKINFDIFPVKQGLALESIVIHSPSMDGKGNIRMSNDADTGSLINIEFSKIDLSEWLKPKKNAVPSNLTKFGNNKRLDFSKSNMSINFLAKAVTINEGNILSNLSLKAHIKDNKFEIEDFTGNGEQGAKFAINGVMTQNSFRNIFNGKIILTHQDLNEFAEFFGDKNLRTNQPIPFSFSSDIKSSSVDMSFQNFLIKTKDAEVLGDVSIKFIGNSPRTNATIKFSSVNLDKSNLPAVSQAFAYIYNLLDDMKEENYLNKFIPIRKINSTSNFEIAIDHLKLNDKLYENINFNLGLSPGKILIEQLYITDGVDWLDTDFSLEAAGIKPNIKLNIKDGSIGVNFLSAPKMLALKERILSNFDLSKIDITTQFSLKNVYQGDLKLGKVTLIAKNDKNLIDISKFNATLFGGQLQSSGSILLHPYTINFVYALNSAQVEQINKLLPPNIINSEGVISASGMVSTNGEKLDEQLYNLYTKSDIIAKDITLNNFSIDDFIQTLSSPNFDVNTLKDELNKALLLNQTKISDLQTRIELSKGIITLPTLLFKTTYSSGKGFAKFSLYDFNVDSIAEFAFYIANPGRKRGTGDYDQTTMSVNVKGNYFNPKKEANIENLEKALKARSKK